MSEIPLVWHKAVESPPTGMIVAEYRYDTDLFYGVKDYDFLLGWIRPAFADGYVATLSWRIAPDEENREIGLTRTLAEAQQLLEGYVHVWWLTPEAQPMKDDLKDRYEKHLQRMSQQQRAASEASARVRNMSTVRRKGSI